MFTKTLTAICAVLALSCNYEQPVNSSVIESARNATTSDREAKELGDYAILMMRIVNANLSDVRRNVVARSIVPPGSHVPCGYLVVDEIFGALGSASKSGTEGGAS